MAEKAKLKIYALPEAPEFVSQGNHQASLEDGCYEVQDEGFAEYLVNQGYGSRTAPESQTDTKKTKTNGGEN